MSLKEITNSRTKVRLNKISSLFSTPILFTDYLKAFTFFKAGV